MSFFPIPIFISCKWKYFITEIQSSKNRKALLDLLLTEIKAQSGTAEQIKAWIQANKTVELQAVEELNKLALLVQQFDNKKH